MGILKHALAAASLAAAWPAAAAVTQSGPAGFTVAESAHIAAPPDQVYAMLTTPARWWSSDHTFSHDAANLSLEPRAGGCWCERLPGGGSVEHMRVVYVAPGRMLRLQGALGPLQEMPVQGVMTITLAGASAGTDVTLTYAVGGSGLEPISGAVDQVLGEQVDRLKAAVETGRP
jgi:uncharacterized protein YndB with AHSA1/START domain